MRTATIAAIAALMFGLGAVTACTGEPEADPTPTPTVVATTPTKSTSPTPSPFASDSVSPTMSPTLDADQLAAQSVVHEFFRISDELAKNPELPLQPLANITTGQTQALELKALADYRSANAVQVGDLEWTILEVGAVEAEGEGKLVLVDVCTDATNLDVEDQATGESILPEDRTPVLQWTIDAVEVNGFWMVGDLTNSEVKVCSL